MKMKPGNRSLTVIVGKPKGHVHRREEEGVPDDEEAEHDDELADVEEQLADDDGPGPEEVVEGEEVEDEDGGEEQGEAEEEVAHVDEEGPVVVVDEEGGGVDDGGDDAEDDEEGLDPGEAALRARVGDPVHEEAEVPDPEYYLVPK